MKKIFFPLIFCLLFVVACSTIHYAIFWDYQTIKDPQQSAGFVEVHDFDDDGHQEILLSTLVEEGLPGITPTKGALRIFRQNLELSTFDEQIWEEEILIGTEANLGFINKPQVFDLNADGTKDILIHQGFLNSKGGSYFWLPGPQFDQMIAVTEETTMSNTLGFFWHESLQLDLDGDGLLDLITTSAKTESMSGDPSDQELPQLRVDWYRHLGEGIYEQHILYTGVGGVFIEHADLDQDNDEDLILSQFFSSPSLLWLEQISAPSENNNWQGEWAAHTIDDSTGLGYKVSLADIDNDNEIEIIYGNHNNSNNKSLVDANNQPIPSGIYWFDLPSDPYQSPWEKQIIDEGYPVDNFDFGNPASQGSPGIFDIADLNNDGLLDLVVPGDGTKNLYFLAQNPDQTFTRSVIAEGVMFGAAEITDIDNNQEPEVLAAMHNAALNPLEVLLIKPGNLRLYYPPEE